MNIGTTSNRLEFDEINHVYKLDGKLITGVTTILSVIAKPALIQWSANRAVEHIGEWFNTNALTTYNNKGEEKPFVEIHKEDFLNELKEAKYAHRKTKESAGDFGTRFHSLIEDYIRISFKTPLYKPTETVIKKVDKDLQKPFREFINWTIENKVRFFKTEERVFSEHYWYAGTYDFICEMGGRILIGDLKTSKGIWPEYYYQLAAYENAVKEMDKTMRIDGGVIVNCKKDGGFEVDTTGYHYESARRAFMGALTIYREKGT